MTTKHSAPRQAMKNETGDMIAGVVMLVVVFGSGLAYAIIDQDINGFIGVVLGAVAFVLVVAWVGSVLRKRGHGGGSDSFSGDKGWGPF